MPISIALRAVGSEFSIMGEAVEHMPATIGDWILGDELGHGSFGVVVKATRADHTPDIYACKVISKAKIQEAGDVPRFEREIRATAQLRHPNLVALHDFLFDPHNYYLVMDYCQGGELLSYISRNGLSAEPFAALVFGQIAAGIAHCHRSGVVHRDIKLENILFTQFPRIKITDFGLCGFITEGKLFTTFCGTACYAAPECLRRDEYDGRLSDVWSLGVLLFAMVVGEFPWDTENLGAMMKQIVTGDYALPDHVSLSCKNLIEGMLHVDPLTRFTMDQVMSHPWMALAQKSVFHFSKTVLLEGQGPVSPTRSLALLETDIRQRAPYAGPIASKSQESVKIDDPHRAPLPRVLTNLNDVPVRKVRPGAALPSQTRPRVKQVVLRKLQ